MSSNRSRGNNPAPVPSVSRLIDLSDVKPGSVADGQVLKRSGAWFVGGNASGATVGTTPGTVAAGETSDVLSPLTLETGATITVGATDESSYIQAQLNAAVAARRAVVYLEHRQWGILPGNIQIPDHVTLAFGGAGSMARQVVNYGAGQPAINPTSGGQFVQLGGSGGSDTAAAYVSLTGVRSALLGASFYDPDNPSSLTTPVAKPFAVRVVNYGGTVKRVEFVNTYRGLDIQGGRVVAEDLTGNPLAIGVRCDAAYDFIHLRTTHFVDSFVRGTALDTWFTANAVGHIFYDVDNIVADDLNTFSYRIGLHVGPSPTNQREVHGPYGVVSNSTFDGCFYAVEDYGTRTNYYPLTLANCTLNTSGYGTTGRCYKADSTKFGITTVDGGSLFVGGDAGTAVEISGGTLVRFVNNHLLMSAIGSPYAFLVNGTVGIDLFGNRINTAGTTKTIMVTPANCNGRIRDNSVGGIIDPANDVSCASTGVDLDTNRKMVSYSNGDYNNVAGANSHLLLANPSTAGQTVIGFVFGPSGTLAGKLRMDYTGSLVYETGAGGQSPGVLTSYIRYPSSDPHNAGVWWDNGGTLTRSAG